MKPILNILFYLTLIVVLFSCTESVKMTYNESKSLPLKVEFNEPSESISGLITTNTLKKLFDIPTDAKVTSFSVNGFSIQVNPTAGTEADFVEYSIVFGEEGEPYEILVKNQRHFVSTGDAFSISSEFDAPAMATLKCFLSNLILEKKGTQCGTISDFQYVIVFIAKDAFGNLKPFKGSMTGTFNFQVTYEVCEKVPEGLFSEFDKCE